jgi:hypothetical protein
VGRGREQAAVPLRQIAEIESLSDPIVQITRRRGGNDPILPEYRSYREELAGVLPDDSEQRWQQFLAALVNFRQAVMLVQLAERHVDDNELYDRAVGNLSLYQDQFIQALISIRDWATLCEHRLDLMIRAI